ncbi:type VI secretion protein [Maribacter algarum]|uniref:Type VI secretion protein n=1 Tax=Maribacter algarum (ex Zhang et al. 2020) TaxID=2578118 RepID=A0A5S3PST5_9FLAO|nr:PAAR domain-containing protein [Maribacter algarum]TMM58013.1 type VI secretion protein [Maribacter algarum]
MGAPAARVNDFHICPMVTSTVPHVGGPISMGATTVKIGGFPAARVGDMCTCSGPPDSILMGSSTVKIEGKYAARLGDSTAHGGTIAVGAFNVLIG